MIEILKFEEYPNGKVFKGKLSIRIPEWKNLIIRDIGYFDNGEKEWIVFPAKRVKDGEMWKISYFYIEFEGRDTKELLEAQIIKALNAKKEAIQEKSLEEEVPF